MTSKPEDFPRRKRVIKKYFDFTKDLMMKKASFTFLLLFFLPTISFSQVQVESYLENAMVTSIKREGNYIWFSTYGQGIYRYSINDEK